jgi:inhibitor of cysteine peptidase
LLACVAALWSLCGVPFAFVDPALSTAAPMAQVLTIHDDGRTIQVGVGVRLELRLPDNPSTGYRWSVEVDSRFVTVEEGVYTQLVHGLGGGGERQWWITTCQAGSTTLRLSRWRPWESEQSAIERFAVTLEILSGHP